MMKLSVVCMFAFVIGVFPIISYGGQNSSRQIQMTNNDGNAASAMSSQAAAAYLKKNLEDQRIIDKKMAPIKSRADLQMYLRIHAVSGSPFDLLSEGAKQRFFSSLKFNETGLVSFRYADLEEELTPEEIYRVLSLFGAQSLTSRLTGAKTESSTDQLIMATPDVQADYKDYWCISPHTCEYKVMDICMHGC